LTRLPSPPPFPYTTLFRSDPAGAAISIDGKETGKLTPASLPLPAGTHMIVLHKQGFVEINNTVSVADGQSYTYANTLQPLPAAQDRKSTRLNSSHQIISYA